MIVTRAVLSELSSVNEYTIDEPGYTLGGTELRKLRIDGWRCGPNLLRITANDVTIRHVYLSCYFPQGITIIGASGVVLEDVHFYGRRDRAATSLLLINAMATMTQCLMETLKGVGTLPAGVLVTNSTLNVVGSLFNALLPSDESLASAIAVEGQSSVSIDSSTFINNDAGNSGGGWSYMH